MFTNRFKKGSFKFEWLASLIFLVFFALFLALGNWQLQRAQQKKDLLDLQNKQLISKTINLLQNTNDQIEELRYKSVTVQGHYDGAHQFLIDNQHHAGKAGYFVLTPFIVEGGHKAVLVNRGWVPLTQDRSVLPDITLKNERTWLSGRINKFPSVGIKLDGAEVPTKNWPSVVQLAESAVLAERLAYPLFTFQIELDKDLPEGYVREWQAAGIMLPEQHKAYAFQWFSLALTVLIIFLAYSLKKNEY